MVLVKYSAKWIYLFKMTLNNEMYNFSLNIASIRRAQCALMRRAAVSTNSDFSSDSSKFKTFDSDSIPSKMAPTARLRLVQIQEISR